MTMRHCCICRSALAGMLLAGVAPHCLAFQTSGEPGVRAFTGSLADIVSNLYGGDGIRLQGSEIFSHAAHFTGDSLEQFNQLSLSVRDLSFPVLNPQFGVRYKYDSVLDEFVPTTESVSASAFAFDADTAGEGAFHIGMAYSVRRFDELGGMSLNELTVDLSHMDLGNNGSDLPCIGGPSGACYTFEKDVIQLSIDLGIEEELFALTGDYGISHNWDIGVFLPLLRTKVDVASSAAIVEHSSSQYLQGSVHAFGGDSDSPNDALRASHTGLGDIVFRTTYLLNSNETDGWRFSAGVDVRLPSGSVQNFQGLPDVGIRPRLVASSEYDFGFGLLRPHVNVGYGFNAGLRSEQLLDYVVGGSLVIGLGEEKTVLAVGADFLGKHVTANTDNRGDNQYDLSLGAKLHFEQSISAYYNILIPMNEAGLRPDAQHVFGVQVKF